MELTKNDVVYVKGNHDTLRVEEVLVVLSNGESVPISDVLGLAEKPDLFRDCPDWVNFIYKQDDNKCFYTEGEPVFNEDKGYFSSTGEYMWTSTCDWMLGIPYKESVFSRKMSC